MKLVLKNVGIIEKADVNVNGLTIIAGINDTGKSTIGKIAYFLTKSFEEFESNYKEARDSKITGFVTDFYRLVRSNVNVKSHAELENPFMNLRRSVESEASVSRLLKSVQSVKKILDDPSVVIEKESRRQIYRLLNKIESLYKETVPKKTKIAASFIDLLNYAFKGEIINAFHGEAVIRVFDGKSEIMECLIKDPDGQAFQIGNSKEVLPLDACAFSEIKWKVTDTIFPFDGAVFIETPLILSYLDDPEFSSLYHVRDLLNKLMSKGKNKSSRLKINKIVKGDVYYDEGDDDFKFKKERGREKVTFNVLNSASGIKSLGLLQMLDRAGEFDKSLLLVIDEPEVHLHPKWQVEYAKVLVSLVKRGIKVLVTSHSPYLIEALNKFSKEEGMVDVKFYLSESDDEGRCKITDKTHDRGKIFDELSKPFEKLIFGE